MSANVLVRRFRRVWRKLALRGHCDAINSAEFRRVLAEWLRAGMPDHCSAFIQFRANIGPSSGGRR